jgi:hypothetical protein
MVSNARSLAAYPTRIQDNFFRDSVHRTRGLMDAFADASSPNIVSRIVTPGGGDPLRGFPDVSETFSPLPRGLEEYDAFLGEMTGEIPTSWLSEVSIDPVVADQFGLPFTGDVLFDNSAAFADYAFEQGIASRLAALEGPSVLEPLLAEDAAFLAALEAPHTLATAITLEAEGVIIPSLYAETSAMIAAASAVAGLVVLVVGAGLLIAYLSSAEQKPGEVVVKEQVNVEPEKEKVAMPGNYALAPPTFGPEGFNTRERFGWFGAM